jgi:hypothetical protein
LNRSIPIEGSACFISDSMQMVQSLLHPNQTEMTTYLPRSILSERIIMNPGRSRPGTDQWREAGGPHPLRVLYPPPPFSPK